MGAPQYRGPVPAVVDEGPPDSVGVVPMPVGGWVKDVRPSP